MAVFGQAVLEGNLLADAGSRRLIYTETSSIKVDRFDISSFFGTSDAVSFFNGLVVVTAISTGFVADATFDGRASFVFKASGVDGRNEEWEQVKELHGCG